MIDIVIPNGNEAEFVSMASKLGYSDLCFAYNINNFNIKKIKELQTSTKIKLYVALVAEKRDVNKARKISDLVISVCRTDARSHFEKRAADVVFGLELVGEKDFIYNPNSGLDQVKCKLARDREVLVGFSFSDILNIGDRAQILSRISQNIKLCRKYRVGCIIASLASEPYDMHSPHDLASFFVCLGMMPKEAKNALNQALIRIKENIEKKSPNYIAKGISKV